MLREREDKRALDTFLDNEKEKGESVFVAKLCGKGAFYF